MPFANHRRLVHQYVFVHRMYLRGFAWAGFVGANSCIQIDADIPPVVYQDRQQREHIAILSQHYTADREDRSAGAARRGSRTKPASNPAPRNASSAASANIGG